MARGKLLIAAGAAVAWLLFFCYQIWINPRIEFLTPSIGASWVMHPEQNVLHFQHGDPSEDVIFKLEFDLKSPPDEAAIKLKAMTGYLLKVNGREIGRSRPDRNWKRFDRYDIADVLKRGRNVVVVLVTNPTGFPALLVKGRAGEVDLSTRPGRWIASKPGKEWVETVPPVYRRPEGITPTMGVLLGAYAAVIASLIALRRLGCVNIDRFLRKPIYWSIASAILIAHLILALHNASAYPYERGIDQHGHVDYIERFTRTLSVPLAFEGWEMFQPPLYYLLASFLLRATGSLKSAQFLTALFGACNVLMAFLILRLMLPGRRELHLLGLLLAAFTPMQLYMSPLITNEVPSAALISISLYLGLRWLEARMSWPRLLALTLSLNAALMTKYTGLFVSISLLLVYLLRAVRRGRAGEVMGVAVVAVGVISISGPFYARNFVVFGDPFVGNWDEQTSFHYEQNPGYRTLSFYLKFGPALYSRNVENLRWISFWDGMYGSAWAEPHFFFAKPGDELAGRLMRWTLFLALLPTVAMSIGLIRCARAAWEGDLRRTAILLLSALTFTSVLYFTMEVPFFSTIKAFFFLSLLPVLALWAAEGFDVMMRGSGHLRWIVHVVLIAIPILSFAAYWY